MSFADDLTDPAELVRLGYEYRLGRQLQAAEAVQRRLLEIDPGNDEAQAGLALILLGQGRIGEGFAAYERRRARLHLLSQPLSFPEWRGEPLAGKRLFVYREQGFGDQVMMARFLRRLGAEAITYAGPPQLERLFGQLGVDYLPLAPGQGLVAPKHDFWTLPHSIPARLNISEAELDRTAYLQAAARPAPGRIGVAWHGEAKNLNDRFRSLPQAQAERLMAVPGAVSLHPQDSGAGDFQDTAELVAGLDLVVTVDTAVAHLAGAMGKPTWVLLAAQALDWQWGPSAREAAWYDSVRLWRQATPGDWSGLVDQVLAALP